MARIQLIVYANPSYAEVFVNLRTPDGFHKRRVATVDTGAEISLLPLELMETIEYQVTQRGKIVINQAGIAKQSFEAIEALIKLFLEDSTGARTSEFTAKVWFAETSTALLGFDGILDQAVLHLEMPNLSGYLELP